MQPIPALEELATFDMMHEDHYRMIDQAAVAHTVLETDMNHNAIWDYAISPQGRHYVAICAEGTYAQYVHVYEYLPDSAELKLLFRLDDKIVTYHDAIRPSKIHSSFAFLPDGRVLMSTHTTAASPLHPTWMPEAYYGHLWEGYAGSNLLIYDPADGSVEDLGIPVIHETIYGGVYHAPSDSFFFGGYIRGHVYRFDMKTRRVTDYGQRTEFGTFRHIIGLDGNIYFTSRTGYMWRINPQKDCVEDIGVQLPYSASRPSSCAHTCMVFGENTDDGKLLFYPAYSESVFTYDYASGRIEDVGSFTPDQFAGCDFSNTSVSGMAIDEDGALWYCFRATSAQHGDVGTYLTRWDYRRGKRPECFGLLGSKERAVFMTCDMYIRGGMLYASDTNHDFDVPAIIRVDLGQLRHGRLGPLCQDPLLVMRHKGATARYEGDLERDSLKYRKTIAHRREEALFNACNPVKFHTPGQFVTKLWREVSPEQSAVQKLWFDEAGNAHAICGRDRFYHLTIRDGVVLNREALDAFQADDAQALKEAFAGVLLPCHPGRQYKATPSAHAPWSGGRALVGTSDGFLAIVENGRARSLGMVSQTGPVRALCAANDFSIAFGVAGHENDLGTVFSYDEQNGVILHGRVSMAGERTVGGLGSSRQIATVAISGDAKRLAIGARDFLGCLYEYDLSDWEPSFTLRGKDTGPIEIGGITMG